jgi:hypothetical protein
VRFFAPSSWTQRIGAGIETANCFQAALQRVTDLLAIRTDLPRFVTGSIIVRALKYSLSARKDHDPHQVNRGSRAMALQ